MNHLLHPIVFVATALATEGDLIAVVLTAKVAGRAFVPLCGKRCRMLRCPTPTSATG